MASKELIPMLEKRRLELLKELHAIDILLNTNKSNESKTDKNAIQPQPQVTTTIYSGNHMGYMSSRDEHMAMLREKTDKVPWKSYVYNAVKILGHGSSDAIVDLIIDTNDHKIPDKRVKQATHEALKALVEEKQLGTREDANYGKVFYLLEKA